MDLWRSKRFLCPVMKPVDEESVADEFPSLQEHVLLRSERVENKHARKHIQDGHFEREVEKEM